VEHVFAFMDVATRNGTEGGGGIRVGSPNENIFLWLSLQAWLIYLCCAHPITGCVYLCSRKSATRQGKEPECPKAAAVIVFGVSVCFAPCICGMLCMGASRDAISSTAFRDSSQISTSAKQASRETARNICLTREGSHYDLFSNHHEKSRARCK
jgi:hypothetical protein